MTTGPPPWAAWLLDALVPRRYHETLAGDVLDRYRDQILPRRGEPAQTGGFSRAVAEWAWTESRLACLIVVLSFVFGDGLYAELPESGATARAWLHATAPVGGAWRAGRAAGWRSGVRPRSSPAFLRPASARRPSWR